MSLGEQNKMSGQEEDHLKYILRKQNKTLSNWDSVMLGKGLFSDFDKLAIKSNTNSSQKTKATPNKSTTDQNIKNKKKVYHSKRQRRFPLGRIEQ